MTHDTNQQAGFSTYFAYPMCLMWAAMWVWLGASTGLRESDGFLGVLAHSLMPGAVFLVLTFLPMWSETIGGIALVVSAVVTAILNPVFFAYVAGDERLNLMLVTALPPLAAGLMFLSDARKRSHA